jgi:hypothetical protein
MGVLFAVDMFDEGVDAPSVDTVLMLRPPESTIVWIQQFGRGLRRAAGKDHLTVVDYIGNHRILLTKARALLGGGAGVIAFRACRAGARPGGYGRRGEGPTGSAPGSPRSGSLDHGNDSREVRRGFF